MKYLFSIKACSLSKPFSNSSFIWNCEITFSISPFNNLFSNIYFICNLLHKVFFFEQAICKNFMRCFCISMNIPHQNVSSVYVIVKFIFHFIEFCFLRKRLSKNKKRCFCIFLNFPQQNILIVELSNILFHL